VVVGKDWVVGGAAEASWERACEGAEEGAAVPLTTKSSAKLRGERTAESGCCCWRTSDGLARSAP